MHRVYEVDHKEKNDMEISAKRVKFALAATADTLIVEMDSYICIYLYTYICVDIARNPHVHCHVS